MERPRLSASRLSKLAGRLAVDRRGATALEYGLILALVVIAMVGALSMVADATVGMWTNTSTKVQNAR
ncbi:MAG TPA: Flp family type IVb pilin [Sphingomonas sp.]|jgi:pilus assembly protein Flp/PilA